MNLRQIEAFRAVMSSGTVTGASELLCVSQPAVSRLIADLERSIDLPLFKREKRRLHPTPEGVAFYAEVEHAFMGLEVLKRKAKDIRQFNSGNLRIISIYAMATGFLPPAIKEFSELHPNVTVSLQTHRSDVVSEWIAAQQFDVGLSFGQIDSPGIRKEAFADVDAVCVLPPGHRLSKKRLIRAADLKSEQFISFAADDYTRLRIEQFFQAAGLHSSNRIEAHLANVVCHLVLKGLGVSIVNPFSAVSYVDRGLVVKRLESSISIPFLLTFPALRPSSALAKSFVEILKKHRNRTFKEFKKLGL